MNRCLDSLKSSREPIRIRKVSISSSRANTSRSSSKSKATPKAVELTSPKKKPVNHFLISKNSDNTDSFLEEDSVLMTLNELLTPCKPQKVLITKSDSKQLISISSQQFFNKRRPLQKLLNPKSNH
jgi:hypothetical protein